MHKIIQIILLVTTLSANEFSLNPSFQGYTGVVNTPNAQVTQEGHATIHLNNQFDNSIRAYDENKNLSDQKDYIFGVGLFSFVEFQGRLSESPGYHRDLSVNAKIQLPFHHKYLPDVAIGSQDIGSAANQYGNNYIVLDKELWFARASLGYGKANTEERKKRMDGLFGSLELKATDWLYFMAENDAKENHVALRLETPKSWMKSMSLRGTIARNVTSQETSVGLTLDIPLWHSSKIEQDETRRIVNTISQENKNETNSEQNSTNSNYNEIVVPEYIPPKTEINSLASLQRDLVNFGFENVRVGASQEKIYIEFENSIFDHTDLDALGYVLGKLSTSKLEYKEYSMILLKNRLETLSMSGRVEDFKNYIENPSLSNEKILQDNLSFSRDTNNSNISFSSVKNSSLFIPRVELSLGLTTAVGTEIGLFDYVASLKSNVYMNIYDGLVVSAMYEMPFANSENFDEGGAFNRKFDSDLLDNKLTSVMAHQTIHYGNIIDTISIGKYKTDYFGLMNQANYTTTSGEHSFNWKAGSFKNEKDTDEAQKEFSLVSYRYAYFPLDLYSEISYGEYWNGDIGTEYEIKRFFGETSVGLNYKNTTKQYVNGSLSEQIVTIGVSFPLTTRKLYKANYIQLKGKNDFSYGLRTTVNKSDGTNKLNYKFGREPMSDFELTSTYLNRDRLSASYVKNHLDRLRESYITYSK